MRLSLLVPGVVLAVSASGACSAADPPSAAPVAAAPDPGPADDGGADANKGPVRLGAPRIVSAGGPVLAHPKLVVATFGDEPFAAQLETFARTIGATPYWKDTTAEYGVGPATFARSVRIPTAPATITQQGVKAWLAEQLDGTHPEWGTPDDETVLTVVYPRSTTVMLGDESSCDVSPAWHGEVVLKSGKLLPYAAITRCDPIIGLEGIDFLTSGLSHEWIEASTNPFWFTKPAYGAPTSEDAHWTTVNSGEVSDMCANTPNIDFVPEGFPFTVQRSWSNDSAAAGHDPCVPRLPEPYFIAATTTAEMVAVGGIVEANTVRGIVVPVGESRTVAIALSSDGATAGPWTVKARDFAPRLGEKPDLELAWDRTSGVNGDILHLTIKRLKADAQLGGAAIFEIVSTLGGRQNIWVAAVGDAAR